MDLLAAVFAPSTLALLDAVGVAAGARCLDVGCGGGHVAIELGRLVGPAGRVVGIDLDTALLEVARTEAVAQGLDHVSFCVGAVEDLAESGFDLACARMLLMHLRDRPASQGRWSRRSGPAASSPWRISISPGPSPIRPVQPTTVESDGTGRPCGAAAATPTWGRACRRCSRLPASPTSR